MRFYHSFSYFYNPQYKCCGVDAYTDFDPSGAWTTAISGVTLVTPVACCKDLPTGNTPSDFDCATSYNATLSNGMTVNRALFKWKCSAFRNVNRHTDFFSKNNI